MDRLITLHLGQWTGSTGTRDCPAGCPILPAGGAETDAGPK